MGKAFLIDQPVIMPKPRVGESSRADLAGEKTDLAFSSRLKTPEEVENSLLFKLIDVRIYFWRFGVETLLSWPRLGEAEEWI